VVVVAVVVVVKIPLAKSRPIVSRGSNAFVGRRKSLQAPHEDLLHLYVVAVRSVVVVVFVIGLELQ